MTSLYRLYAADGRLLYVGIADNFPSRLKQHSKDKAWFGEVASTSQQQFGTREEAAAAEVRAICNERPVHNVVHNGQRQPPAAARFKERWINWVCELCGEPIDLTAKREPGYLQITSAERIRHHQESEAWKAQYPNGEYTEPINDRGWRFLNLDATFEMPKPMHWEHVCRECDQARNQEREAAGLNPDGGHYWIDLRRVRTPGNFLEWNAHVLEKRWVAGDTDWLRLSAKVAGWLGSKGC